jgi:hypothetical protein
VVELMTLMASGDAAAAFTLYEEFGAVIRRVLRGHLADLHATRVPDDDLDGLTLDATLALLDAAPSWRADRGAMPWTLAAKRLRSLASSYVGQWTQELGDDHDGPAPGPAIGTETGDDMHSLATVAATDPTVQLLIEALHLRCSARDAEILMSVKAQAAAGDPSPANTVAAQHGMKPAAVRQVVKRSRDAVRGLAEHDERFTPLRGLALLAP